jgi:antitoxin YefM
MDRTTANDFRTNLKEWMEAARKEPVKITRKSGEAFVLVNADEFEKMQLKLARLQGLNTGLMDTVQGRISSADETSTQDILDRAKSRALAAKKPRRAVG